MISPELFYNSLCKRGVGLFAGVPDSLLKHLCAFFDSNCRKDEHVITANEGNAVALAAGFYLSTGKLGAVYMQNSGLGNCVNPLTSLSDPEVYSIPMLLIIGWRGEPGAKDEPQHIKQGRITTGQLELMEIPYQVLQADSDLDQIIEDVFNKIKKNRFPAALLIKKGTFASCTDRKQAINQDMLKREEALAIVLDLAGREDLFVSTTGKTSRELFEIRATRGETQRDFLTVGSMGHTSSIALGVAMGNPGRRVVCLDGDGSVIMHMGSMPVIGSLKPANLIHVLLNNSAHESVGGQPTVAGQIDFEDLAISCGYRTYHCANDIASLKRAWLEIEGTAGPHLLEIKICTGSRVDLGRPTSTPQENKESFMKAIGGR